MISISFTAYLYILTTMVLVQTTKAPVLVVPACGSTAAHSPIEILVSAEGSLKQATESEEEPRPVSQGTIPIISLITGYNTFLKLKRICFRGALWISGRKRMGQGLVEELLYG
jgi:hypothetical protein